MLLRKPAPLTRARGRKYCVGIIVVWPGAGTVEFFLNVVVGAAS